MTVVAVHPACISHRNDGSDLRLDATALQLELTES